MARFPSGLTHYWPILSGSKQDCVGSNHMTDGALSGFTQDRNSLANDAIDLNGGYTNFPADVYFNSAFTITAWVYPSNLGTWSRIVDFGSGASFYNILFIFTAGLSNELTLHLYSNGNPIMLLTPSFQLTLNTWSFVATTYDGYTGKLYANGVLVGSQTNAAYWIPENVVRTENYCGKSGYAADGYSNSYVDQIQIYNRALSQAEIVTLQTLTN